MTGLNVGLALSYVKLLFPSWETYMCIYEGMVYQQIVRIPMSTTQRICFYFMRGILCLADHIDMFNDTSRYLDDIVTIDNPAIEQYYS